MTIFKPSLTFGANVLLPQAGGDGSWIHRLRHGKPILSVGDGLNYFQFLPSRDAGIAFAAVLGRAPSLGEVYNLVHPVPRTWDHWHREVGEALGVEVKLVHVPQEALIGSYITTKVWRVKRELRTYSSIRWRQASHMCSGVPAGRVINSQHRRKHRLDGPPQPGSREPCQGT